MGSQENLTPAALQALLEGAAMTPPSGENSNFVDPPTFNTAMLVVDVLFLVLATLTVFIRMYTKIFINRKAHLEDCESNYSFLSYRNNLKLINADFCLLAWVIDTFYVVVIKLTI